ncbi:acetyl-CoA carboxylase, carboxyltransferase subunit beta [Oscillospiraceae bacterium PP1C4]
MLEDLFSKVKLRASYDKPSAQKGKMNIPENLMFKCSRCGKVDFMDAFVLGNKVCPSCGYHTRLSSAERIELTADNFTFVEFDKHMKSLNPIHFEGYTEKTYHLRRKTGLHDAVITGECSIMGMPCAIGVMDTGFMMGSMGSVVGEKIARLFEQATDRRLPVVLFTASGGARMQEGIVSLMQMAKTAGAVGRHSRQGLLYLTVLTDPTTGGVTASFASLGDIIIAEPKVLVGFAGRRVIEGTIKQHLPDDFQLAEFGLEHGFVDMIVQRSALRKTIAQLLKLHGGEVADNADSVG